MDLWWLQPLSLIMWIVGTVVNGMVAKEKKRSVGNAVLVSIIFSPLTSYLYLLAVPVGMVEVKVEDKKVSQSMGNVQVPK